MRSFKFIFVVLSLVLTFSTSFGQNKKIAVVTFYVDKHIGFSELNENAALLAAIGSLAENPNFDLTSVLNNFHEVFFTEYSKKFPFDIVPEEEVLGNELYQNYESKWGETSDDERSIFMQRYLAYPGYKPMEESLGKKNRNDLKMLEIFKDVDGVMFVYLDYNFVPKMAIGGMGSAGVKANVRMKLWNKEGKRVFAFNESAVSKKSVGMAAGIPVMDVKKLLPLCESASEELLKDLEKKLAKIAKKAAKKL